MARIQGPDTTVIGYLIANAIIVAVNERFDTDGGRFTVVGNALVGNVNVIKVFQSLSGLSDGKPKIHMEVRQRDIALESNLVNFKEEAFLGRVFKSI